MRLLRGNNCWLSGLLYLSGQIQYTPEMHVLMFSIGIEALLNRDSDTLERHLVYARKAGRLTMIVYSRKCDNLDMMRPSPELAIYPTNSLNKVAWFVDALRLGMRICREDLPDLITAQDPFGTALAGICLKKRFGLPLEIQNHSDFLDNKYWLAERPLLFRLFNLISRHTLPCGDLLRVLSEVEKEKYLQLSLSPERIRILATPVNIERFREQADLLEMKSMADKWGIKPEMPVGIWVGRMVPFKRIQVLLRVVRLIADTHPDFKMLVVGTGIMMKKMRSLVLKLNIGDNVVFTGSVEHGSLPVLYGLADLYIHTSVYEGLGKVMIEAMACGLPVVSTRTSGAMEIIRHGETGMLCPLHDPVKIAASCLELIENRELKESMGRRAREYALSNYGLETGTDQIVRAWADTVGRIPLRRP